MVGPTNVCMELASAVCCRDGSAEEIPGAKTIGASRSKASEIVTTRRLSRGAESYPGGRPASTTV